MSHLEQMTKLYLDLASEIERYKTENELLKSENERLKSENQFPRELQNTQKGRRRRDSAEGAEGAPKIESVFTKTTPISDALCTFLGVEKGSSLSRSEVTTKICNYAKIHGLMDKQIIRADAALRKLLSLTETDELKILNLQRYLKPHYM